MTERFFICGLGIKKSQAIARETLFVWDFFYKKMITEKEMPELNFTRMAKELSPSLKRLSRKNRHLGFIDKDDLYQEALINLWSRLEKGELNDKTASYIVRGCYFHIQNYIRTHKVRNNVLSLEEPIVFEEGRQSCLKDMLKDEKPDLLSQLNSRFIVDDIMNNGLSKREKDVFRLLYKGLNVRQVAKRLGISHVRVVKLRQNINHKYKDKFFDTAVTRE